MVPGLQILTLTEVAYRIPVTYINCLGKYYEAHCQGQRLDKNWYHESSLVPRPSHRLQAIKNWMVGRPGNEVI